jgi:hypothetical protein
MYSVPSEKFCMYEMLIVQLSSTLNTWAWTLLTLLDNQNKVIWHMGTPRSHPWNKLLLETKSRLEESE